MSSASAQVIAHRTARMAAAGPLPNARDRNEFTRMGQEKIEAAMESAGRVASNLTLAHAELGARAVRDILSWTTSLTALATSRTAAQFIARQARVAETASRSAKTALEISRSGARLARHGLAPIHARATANARRLNGR